MDQKRVWLYCRVAHSGVDSAEMLMSQRHRLEDYAKKHGFEIVGSSSDIGSGLTFDRPGLLEFHAAAEGGMVDVLLVHKLSRLGRDVNEVTKYWHLLRDLAVSGHTADLGEIDLSFDTTLRGMIEEMRKRPQVGAQNTALNSFKKVENLFALGLTFGCSYCCQSALLCQVMRSMGPRRKAFSTGRTAPNLGLGGTPTRAGRYRKRYRPALLAKVIGTFCNIFTCQPWSILRETKT